MVKPTENVNPNSNTATSSKSFSRKIHNPARQTMLHRIENRRIYVFMINLN